MCWNKGRLYWKIAKLFYFCHIKKLVRPETFGPTLVHYYLLFTTKISILETNSKEDTNHQLIHTTGYLHASNDFTTSHFCPWILLARIILSIAKRWQHYLSSDGETCAVYGGAGSLQAHHHCHYCCCYYCYCLLLSCHSTPASHPANLLVPEHTVTTKCEQAVTCWIWKWLYGWNNEWSIFAGLVLITHQ